MEAEEFVQEVPGMYELADHAAEGHHHGYEYEYSLRIPSADDGSHENLLHLQQQLYDAVAFQQHTQASLEKVASLVATAAVDSEERDRALYALLTTLTGMLQSIADVASLQRQAMQQGTPVQGPATDMPGSKPWLPSEWDVSAPMTPPPSSKLRSGLHLGGSSDLNSAMDTLREELTRRPQQAGRRAPAVTTTTAERPAAPGPQKEAAATGPGGMLRARPGVSTTSSTRRLQPPDATQRQLAGPSTVPTNTSGPLGFLSQTPSTQPPTLGQPQALAPQASHSLSVHIFGVRGLRRADAYCVVEVAGQQQERLRTTVVDSMAVPEWNYEGQIQHVGDVQDLVFKVMERNQAGNDQLMGQGALPSSALQHGSSGVRELPLATASGTEAFLKVLVTLAPTNPGGSPQAAAKDAQQQPSSPNASHVLGNQQPTVPQQLGQPDQPPPVAMQQLQPSPQAQEQQQPSQDQRLQQLQAQMQQQLLQQKELLAGQQAAASVEALQQQVSQRLQQQEAQKAAQKEQQEKIRQQLRESLQQSGKKIVPLNVVMAGARDLKSETLPDPYCVVFTGDPRAVEKGRTPAGHQTRDPDWHAGLAISDYVDGDSLHFRVYDQARSVDGEHEVLAQVTLPASYFLKPGGSGGIEIPLSNKAGQNIKAGLRIRVDLPQETPGGDSGGYAAAAQRRAQQRSPAASSGSGLQPRTNSKEQRGANPPLPRGRSGSLDRLDKQGSGGARTPRTPTPKRTWTCSRCTFENPSERMRDCQVCANPRFRG
eukprot:TRINITY_DN50397_c0_g1_i2.p1 TRINITY_DN50397_c0_g1~~TRINITY_DN50397_c0_g1_i2.p1  ORF type:complete len:896 (+),score=215.20 TRINITY_DN50397_c0_g1_i2:393-2690(+)